LEGKPEYNPGIEALRVAREATDPAEAQASYQEAYEELESFLNGNDPTPFILAAQAQIGLEEFEMADALIERFERLSPECRATVAYNTRYNAWVELYNAGIRAYQENDTETALTAFDLANLMHKDGRSLFNTGYLYEQQGDEAKAVENYRAALQAEGEADQLRDAALSLAELLMRQGDTEGAVAVYEGFLERFPEEVVTQIRYALALGDAGQADESAAIFDDVMNRDDLGAEQWFEVGVGLFNSGSYEAATDAFTRTRTDASYTFRKEAMENVVNASVEAERASSVIALADTLVAWYPYEQSAYQLLASALAKSDEQSRALSVMQDSEMLPVLLRSTEMTDAGEGQYLIRGLVDGQDATAGTTVTIPFEFLGADGLVAATEAFSVDVPVMGESESFRFTVTSETPLVGFRYGEAQGL
jgi:tetratricopeptide (TPR) repeat protein